MCEYMSVAGILQPNITFLKKKKKKYYNNKKASKCKREKLYSKTSREPV